MVLTTQLWPWLAIAFSFCGALIIGFNQAAQLPGHAAVVWRLLGILPLALASMLVLPWPHDPALYAGAAFLGIILAFADVRLYRASALYGGRLAALYIPLKIALSFGLWAAIAPATLQPFAASPGRALMVIGAFILGWVALLTIRSNDISTKAIKALLPVAAGLAAADVVAKLCLPVGTETLLAAQLGRVVAVLTVGGLSSAAIVAWRYRPGLPTNAQALWGIGLGLLHLCGLSVLLLALSLAPNPGYVGSLTVLSAAWLAVYAHFFKSEHNSLWSGLLLVFSGAVVAWATAF